MTMGENFGHRRSAGRSRRRAARGKDKSALPPMARDRELSTSQQEGIRRLLDAVLALSRNGGASGAGDAAEEGPARIFDFTPKAARYETRDTVATGGMGRITRVFDRDLWRLSAMKIALPEIQANAEFAARFITEGRITALLEHPNIVPVHDIGRDADGNLFFTMKLVAGEPLSEILNRLEQGDPLYESEFPLHRLILIFRKVCDAVAFAHSRGVIHRDIKPHNIMVGPFGEVLLMDWGLAKFIAEPADEQCDAEAIRRNTRQETRPTTIGVVKGTPSYMAPEQAAGLVWEVDERTDIFLLGGTLFHILALRPPYVGRSADEIVLRAMDGHPSPLTEEEKQRCHDVPEELWRIVRRAMAPRREDRYGTIEELIDDLDAWMTGRVLSTHRTFPAGSYLLRAGEDGEEAYVILKGRVRVINPAGGRPVLLGELGPGEVVGEMALLTREPRSADVLAVEDTEVEVISPQTMQAIFRNLPPWMNNIVTALVHRLRAANARIHALASGDCVYSVLKTALLLAHDPEAARDLDALVSEISGLLGVDARRVRKVLEGASEAGLVQAAGRVVISDEARLRRFLAFCTDPRFTCTDENEKGNDVGESESAPDMPDTEERSEFRRAYETIRSALDSVHTD